MRHGERSLSSLGYRGSEREAVLCIASLVDLAGQPIHHSPSSRWSPETRRRVEGGRSVTLTMANKSPSPPVDTLVSSVS
jgi:hypothetical protein